MSLKFLYMLKALQYQKLIHIIVLKILLILHAIFISKMKLYHHNNYLKSVHAVLVAADAFLICRFDKELNKEVAIKVIDLEES